MKITAALLLTALAITTASAEPNVTMIPVRPGDNPVAAPAPVTSNAPKVRTIVVRAPRAWATAPVPTGNVVVPPGFEAAKPQPSWQWMQRRDLEAPLLIAP